MTNIIKLMAVVILILIFMIGFLLALQAGTDSKNQQIVSIQENSSNKFKGISNTNAYQSSLVSGQSSKPINSSTATVDSKSTMNNDPFMLDDKSQIVYIDAKNPPQFIQKYMNCETKNVPKFTGGFRVSGNELKYNCAPQDESEFFCTGSDKDNKDCIPQSAHTPVGCDMSVENIINDPKTNTSLKSKYLKAQSIEDIENSSLIRCLIFTKIPINQQELKSIVDYNPNFRIVNYSD